MSLFIRIVLSLLSVIALAAFCVLFAVEGLIDLKLAAVKFTTRRQHV